LRRPRSIWERYGLETSASSASRRTDNLARSRWLRMKAPTSRKSGCSVVSPASVAAGVSPSGWRPEVGMMAVGRSASQQAVDGGLALAVAPHQLGAERVEPVVAIAAVVGHTPLESGQL